MSNNNKFNSSLKLYNNLITEEGQGNLEVIMAQYNLRQPNKKAANNINNNNNNKNRNHMNYYAEPLLTSYDPASNRFQVWLQSNNKEVLPGINYNSLMSLSYKSTIPDNIVHINLKIAELIREINYFISNLRSLTPKNYINIQKRYESLKLSFHISADETKSILNVPIIDLDIHYYHFMIVHLINYMYPLIHIY